MKTKNVLYKSFCIPYNGDNEAVFECIEKYSPFIFEFYGCDDFFSSGRTSSYVKPKRFSEVLKVMKDYDIEFNYLINAFLLDDYLVRFKDLQTHLAYLRDIGITTVTTSSPYFLLLLKRLGFKVSTSLMQAINTESSLDYHIDLGYDRVIIDENEIRNINKIRTFRAATTLPIEIIVNSCCLKDCPFWLTHCNAESMSNKNCSAELLGNLHLFCKKCKNYWYSDPSLLLKSMWIRPEELYKYKEIGVDYFKLGGRSKPSKDNIFILDTYIKQSWGGSIFDYLKPGTDPSTKFGIYHIQNKALKKFFDFFFEDAIGCNGNCRNCGHCEKWSRIVKLNPEFKMDNSWEYPGLE